MSWLVALPALLFVILAPSTGAAPELDTTALPDTVRAYLNRPDHRQAVQVVAVQMFEKLQACSTGTARPLDRPEYVSMAGVPKTAPDGTLVQGMVKEGFTVSGCGKERIENVLTLAEKGQVKTLPGIPGTSIADPVLAHDSLPYAYRGILKQVGDCKDIRFVDTKFDEFEGPPNPAAQLKDHGGRPWHETWTLDACGKLVDSELHFVPDDKGMLIKNGTTGQK